MKSLYHKLKAFFNIIYFDAQSNVCVLHISDSKIVYLCDISPNPYSALFCKSEVKLTDADILNPMKKDKTFWNPISNIELIDFLVDDNYLYVYLDLKLSQPIIQWDYTNAPFPVVISFQKHLSQKLNKNLLFNACGFFRINKGELYIPVFSEAYLVDDEFKALLNCAVCVDETDKSITIAYDSYDQQSFIDDTVKPFLKEKLPDFSVYGFYYG